MTVSLLEEDLIFSPSYKFPTFFLRTQKFSKWLSKDMYICLTFCQDVWCEIWEWLLLLYCTACTHLFYFIFLVLMAWHITVQFQNESFFQSQLKKWWQQKTSYLKWTCYWYNMVRIITCYCSLLLFILQGSMNYFCHCVSFKIGRLVNFV